MSEDIAATVICLWCNRVQAWGKADISYEVCLACTPRVADEVRTLHAGRTGAGLGRRARAFRAQDQRTGRLDAN